MSDDQPKAIPTWFWITAILALVWNIMGVNAYITQVTLTPEDLAAMTQAQQDLYINTPAWVNGAFAFSVFGGALGCILMLLKKTMAQKAFVVSLLAVVIQMGHAFLMTDALEVFGPGAAIMPVMIIIVAALLIVFARSSEKKGWIR